MAKLNCCAGNSVEYSSISSNCSAFCSTHSILLSRGVVKMLDKADNG